MQIHLVRDLLAAPDGDRRGEAAATLLGRASPSPRVDAALATAARRGLLDRNAPAQTALEALRQRSPTHACQIVLQAAKAKPGLPHYLPTALRLVHDGHLPAAVLRESATQRDPIRFLLAMSRLDPDPAPRAELLELVAALVHFPWPKCAAGAAGVLARFDLARGLSALAIVNRRKLESQFLRNFPHDEVPELQDWTSRAGEAFGPSVLQFERALPRYLSERGLTPRPARSWAEACAALDLGTLPEPTTEDQQPAGPSEARLAHQNWVRRAEWGANPPQAALAAWTHGASEYRGWRWLAIRLAPFATDSALQSRLVHDLLAAAPDDERGECAVRLLEHAPGPQVTAALAYRVQLQRHAKRHDARLGALRALLRREPERGRPFVYQEAVTHPELLGIHPVVLDWIEANEAPLAWLRPLVTGPQPDRFLDTCRLRQTLTSSTQAVVEALVHHPEASVATRAASVLARFDLPRGLQALAVVDLSHLERRDFRAFPHDVAGFQSLFDRLGPVGRVMNARLVQGWVDEALQARGLSPLPARRWPDEALADVDFGTLPTGPWPAAEAALIDPHRAWLTSLAPVPDP